MLKGIQSLIGILWIFNLLQPAGLHAQDTFHLKAVDITRDVSEHPGLYDLHSMSLIDSLTLAHSSGQSVVSTLNTVPGVRMEERSPGSYRLSVRGSLLRSPFGIRNVTVFLDGFLLTDASGETYLNLLDAAAVRDITVFKGPQAAYIGANTGGSMGLNTFDVYEPGKEPTGLEAGLTGGSYGLLHAYARAHGKKGGYNLKAFVSRQQSNGYRENSALQRNFVHLLQNCQYKEKNTLQLLVMFSDLHYQTPGGLTASQFAALPEAARPATATLPGAVAQQAGIYNKSLFTGLGFERRPSNHLYLYANMTYMYSDFANPFITNYEQRFSHTLGLYGHIYWLSPYKEKFHWSGGLSIQSQATSLQVANYGNNGGMKDSLQASDRLGAGRGYVSGVLRFYFKRYWIVEAALSLNDYAYRFKNIYPVLEARARTVNFSPRLMPSLTLTRNFKDKHQLRLIVSRGYSPPTLSEVRPSNNLIYDRLRAESGWNFETGCRFFQARNRLWLDASVFYFRLRNAIVPRQDSTGAEYFINAGGTRQLGSEVQLNYWIKKPISYGWLRALQFKTALTWSYFTFAKYMVGTNDYSGNRLTGVPATVSVSSLGFYFPRDIYLFVQYNYTSRLPLNDANTVYANGYHLLEMKAGGPVYKGKKLGLYLEAGANNLLNEKYSLGNDLNAAGGRYYNAAPLMNYYAGLKLNF